MYIQETENFMYLIYLYEFYLFHVRKLEELLYKYLRRVWYICKICIQHYVAVIFLYSDET